MDINIIEGLIGSVGFPVVACGALFWYMTKLERQHKEETDSLRSVLENNTAAIIRLTERLEEREK